MGGGCVGFALSSLSLPLWFDWYKQYDFILKAHSQPSQHFNMTKKNKRGKKKKKDEARDKEWQDDKLKLI